MDADAEQLKQRSPAAAAVSELRGHHMYAKAISQEYEQQLSPAARQEQAFHRLGAAGGEDMTKDKSPRERFLGRDRR